MILKYNCYIIILLYNKVNRLKMENNKIVYRTFITTMQMLRDRNYSEGSLLSISKNQLVNISKLIDMSFNDFMLSFGKDNALEIDYSKLIFI